MRSFASVAATAALLLAAAAPALASPHHHHHHPHPTFGAIAYTAAGGYAWTTGHASKDEAEAAALAKCVALDGGPCRLHWFGQKQCAALVSSGQGISFSALALTPNDSIIRARNNCALKGFAQEQCQLRTVVCGYGR